MTTTGMDTGSGAHPQATATDKAPKDTWLRPSPIMEYRFSTRGTPKSAAHTDTKIPTTKRPDDKRIGKHFQQDHALSPPNRRPMGEDR